MGAERVRMSVVIQSFEDINKIYADFSSIDKGDISKTDKDNLRKCLHEFPADKLNGIEDHKHFIELVKLYREVVLDDLKYVGTNFVDMIKGMLAVGNDGIYSGELRFLFELIQNVDDCDYDDISDSDLQILFKWNVNPGEIVLKYNEKGFTPGNIFDITGIAEKSKNVDAKKIEIGEKGIGFKSVFGVADKVHIKSGFFSFILNKDNFTVPYPQYDSSDYTKGTEMILYMTPTRVKELYKLLIKQYYNDKNAILNNNPILFLNKLTHIWMGFDRYRFIEFSVTRKKELGEDFELERNVKISMNYYDHGELGVDHEEHRVLNCFRYYKPVEYDRDACISRYGKNTSFDIRRMAIIAIIPIDNDVNLFNHGRFYSFLPTAIKMNAPIAVHAPFKLDISREYVDPQCNNRWFRITLNALENFYTAIYRNLAKYVGNRIIEFIPDFNEYWWKKDNPKVDCLCVDYFLGSELSKKKIFIDKDNDFKSAKDVISFSAEDYDIDQETIYKYLNISKTLFIPSQKVNMERFGVEIIRSLNNKLYSQLWELSDFKKEIYHVLLDANYDFKKKFNLSGSIQFDKQHISIIANDKDIFNIYKQIFGLKELLVHNKFFLKKQDFKEIPQNIKNTFFRLMNDIVIDSKIKEYLNRNKDNIYVVDGNDDRFFFMAANAIVVSKDAPLKAFGFLVQEYDDKNTFSATLKLRQASQELDNVSEFISDEDYLDALINVRTSIMNAFGKNVYTKYVQLINESGADSSRFIQELLQNADDCIYSDANDEPSFHLEISDSVLTITYNEDGFTRKNVRAITAIGESTKKLIYSDSIQTIGEKGVGFKSVFSVADKVQIHSNGFHFELSDKKPTVPAKCKPISKKGTTMIFSMKKNPLEFLRLKISDLLRLVLCLRKLKFISINGMNIIINDTDKERIITIDNTEYHFERIKYNFSIYDNQALIEKSESGKAISRNQSVVCYLPDSNYNSDYYLYSGLPLSIKTLIPVIIDAPFDLTTSRDYVKDNQWNNIIRANVYNALLEVINTKKESNGIDVLKYIHLEGNAGNYTVKIFDDQYLNKGFEYLSGIKKMPVLKVIDEEKYVRAIDNCVIVPNILIKKDYGVSISNFIPGNILELKNNKYNTILKLLGCKQAEIKEVFICINEIIKQTNYSIDFIKSVYSYLSNDDISKSESITFIKNLPIFPVKIDEGIKFIPFNDNIYFADSGISHKDYYILDTSILSYEIFCKITGNKLHINKLTQEVLDKKYADSLITLIKGEESDKKIARDLLREYQFNRDSLKKCKYTLLGIKAEIPMKMVDGSYKRKPKFINKDKNYFDGNFLASLCIDEDYEGFAKFLEIHDLSRISYEDIPTNIAKITSDDIEDLRACFSSEKYVELIKGLIKKELVPEELILKYGLEYGPIKENLNFDEDFPLSDVKNREKTLQKIRTDWTHGKNPYEMRQYINWVPKFANNLKHEYLYNMYGSEDEGYCFCQLCKRKISTRYTEANEIEKEPAFAWKQMYVLLCLECSKDYKAYRNDDKIWYDFVSDIMNVTFPSCGLFDISLGDIKIRFTAVHITEIQEILKCEGWPNELPKRKSD